jgi:hypothetical protein
MILCVSTLACSDKDMHQREPSDEDVQIAFDRAIIHLNEKIGADISSFNYDWVEVPSDCYGELDYYAQQFLWAYIFQEDAVAKNVFFIDCSIAEKYSKLSINVQQGN